MEYGRINRYRGGFPVGRYILVAKGDFIFFFSFFFWSWEVRLVSKIFRHFVEMNYHEKLRFCFFKRMMSAVPMFTVRCTSMLVV